ncbi:DNA methyltransferase [Staphylococcus cohnii]|uniref:DNA methyltransferase n=1 Tax=Staphylococcus cohnii TaxID=29382 RepID=UPI0011A2E740|nr:site-specific DNA-methyltransferase [Staphylococcus cohnii]
MSSTILNEISDVLNDIEKYRTNENLAKQIIIEDLRNNDTKLISKLLSSEIINEIYVQDIDGYKIFDKEAFISMLRYKNYWMDSYTKYANKIGLTAEGKYLNYNSDVVLDFPFKDCILEGGMTKEDSILKNNEKFYNQVIAKEEIDTLLAPKVFTNMKKYQTEGEYKVDEIKDDDNLIIKGNNFISLHSLRKRYLNKVKMIYIDPPYNTGNDEFKYNDKFNKATWLTFMKNRLEAVKDLLTDDGLIFIHIDSSRSSNIGTTMYPYLHILMDEVMGRENYMGTLHWKKKKQPSFLSKIAGVMENILVYAKNYEQVNKLAIGNTGDETKRVDNNSNTAVLRMIKKGIQYRGKEKNLIIKKGKYKNKSMITEYLDDVYIENGIVQNDFKAIAKFRNSQEDITKFCEENLLFITKNKTFRRYTSEIEKENKKTISDLLLDWGQNQDGNHEIENLFGEKVFSTPKPELLISNIIESSTEKGDIIFDFFMGSATTQAVAHKMNRQYIGIEQMDYINSVSVPRLQKVIEGEQGGISTEVDWQGGGSFVYVELAKENQEIVESIINCDSKEELNHKITKLLNNGVLNYEVDFDKFTSTKKEFSELELEDQKEVLIRILDNNQLYVNYSDIEDSAYNFTEDEIAFNHSFYGGE